MYSDTAAASVFAVFLCYFIDYFGKLSHLSKKD